MGGDGMRSGEEMRVERYYMWDDARRVEWGCVTFLLLPIYLSELTYQVHGVVRCRTRPGPAAEPRCPLPYYGVEQRPRMQHNPETQP